MAGEDLVDHYPECVLIGPPVDRLALDLLGSHVMWGAQRHSGARNRLRGNFGNAEIGDLGNTVAADDDVGGFHIAMHHALCVGMVEAGSGLFENREQQFHGRFVRRAQNLGEVLALYELHHYVGEVVLLPNLINRDDVGMGKNPGRLRFAVEPLFQELPLVVFLYLAQVNRLDRHGPLNEAIHPTVNHTHSAAPKLAEDLVVSDAFKTHLHLEGNAALAVDTNVFAFRTTL